MNPTPGTEKRNDDFMANNEVEQEVNNIIKIVVPFIKEVRGQHVVNPLLIDLHIVNPLLIKLSSPKTASRSHRSTPPRATRPVRAIRGLLEEVVVPVAEVAAEAMEDRPAFLEHPRRRPVR